MSNENESEDVVDVPEVNEVKDAEGNDTTDWKAMALAQREIAIKNQGIAKRFKTKLEKVKVEKPIEPVKKEEKSGETLDYAQKAYLKASGINTDEFDFFKKEMEVSGKDIDSLLSSGYFQSELKKMREEKSAVAATPPPTRSAAPAENSKVDYWIAKGELPQDMDLRIQVVNKKMELSRQGRSFKP